MAVQPPEVAEPRMAALSRHSREQDARYERLVGKKGGWTAR
jgi:hypothetical protein